MESVKANPQKRMVLSSSMMFQFLRFPESDSTLKYGCTVLSEINKSCIKLLVNFHLFGDERKIRLASACTKTLMETNSPRGVAHKKVCFY